MLVRGLASVTYKKKQRKPAASNVMKRGARDKYYRFIITMEINTTDFHLLLLQLCTFNKM